MIPMNCTAVFRNAFNKAQELWPSTGGIVLPDSKVCLEFGVAWGNSYLWAAQQIRDRNLSVTYLGFDSWQGLPKEDSKVWCPDHWKEGSFAAPKTYVNDGLKELGLTDDHRFKLMDGWFNTTLTKTLQDILRDKIIFVNIDVDIYASAMEVLNFIGPILRPNVVIYWDDWKDPVQIPNAKGAWGEHRAWAEWSALHPNVKYEELEVNEVNQRSWRIVSV